MGNEGVGTPGAAKFRRVVSWILASCACGALPATVLLWMPAAGQAFSATSIGPLLLWMVAYGVAVTAATSVVLTNRYGLPATPQATWEGLRRVPAAALLGLVCVGGTSLAIQLLSYATKALLHGPVEHVAGEGAGLMLFFVLILPAALAISVGVLGTIGMAPLLVLTKGQSPADAVRAARSASKGRRMGQGLGFTVMYFIMSPLSLSLPSWTVESHGHTTAFPDGLWPANLGGSIAILATHILCTFMVSTYLASVAGLHRVEELQGQGPGGASSQAV